MSDRKMIGFIVQQYGAPGPASGVSYDIKVNEDNQSVTYTGVVPSTPRPPEEIDVGEIEPNTAVEAWRVGGVMHFLFTEYPHTDECPGGAPIPLMSRMLSAIATASPAERAALRAALGVTPI